MTFRSAAAMAAQAEFEAAQAKSQADDEYQLHVCEALAQLSGAVRELADALHEGR